MYSKFSCNDLTESFNPDLTSDFYSSADATPTGALASIEQLKSQLEKALKDLDEQQKIYNDNRTYWDACTWKNPAFQKSGYRHNGVYADSDCKNARDRMASAQGKIDGLNKLIPSLKDSIDKVSSTDPAVLKAKGEAQALADAAKIQAEAVAKSTESQGAAAAQRIKMIGFAVAGVVLIGGIIWAISRFRKK